MRDEVPGTALEHEAERIERALHDPASLPVARPQPPPLPGRGCDRREVRDGVLGPEPAAGVQMEVPLRATRPLLQVRRQRGQDLETGVREHTAEAELCRRRRRDEQRLRLLGREPGELRPVPAGEPIAPCGPTQRLDRNAGGSERLDVAMNRADRDPEVLGELGCGELPPQLQEEKQRNQPCCPHRAETYMTEPGMYMP